MLELLLLPFKIAVFMLKLALGLVFALLGILLLPLLILAGLCLLVRCLVC